MSASVEPMNSSQRVLNGTGGGTDVANMLFMYTKKEARQLVPSSKKRDEGYFYCSTWVPRKKS